MEIGGILEVYQEEDGSLRVKYNPIDSAELSKIDPIKETQELSQLITARERIFKSTNSNEIGGKVLIGLIEQKLAKLLMYYHTLEL